MKFISYVSTLHIVICNTDILFYLTLLLAPEVKYPKFQISLKLPY